MDSKAIGARIKLYRAWAKMTQTELAEKLGCTSQHISAMERGIKTPRLDTFVSVANILGVQPSLLLQDVTTGWKADWEANLNRVLEAVPPDARRRIKQEIMVSRQAVEDNKEEITRMW